MGEINQEAVYVCCSVHQYNKGCPPTCLVFLPVTCTDRVHESLSHFSLNITIAIMI